MLNYSELILCEKTRKLHERGGNYIRYGMTSDNMVRTSIDNLVKEKWVGYKCEKSDLDWLKV